MKEITSLISLIMSKFVKAADNVVSVPAKFVIKALGWVSLIFSCAVIFWVVPGIISTALHQGSTDVWPILREIVIGVPIQIALVYLICLGLAFAISYTIEHLEGEAQNPVAAGNLNAGQPPGAHVASMTEQEMAEETEEEMRVRIRNEGAVINALDVKSIRSNNRNIIFCGGLASIGACFIFWSQNFAIQAARSKIVTDAGPPGPEEYVYFGLFLVLIGGFLFWKGAYKPKLFTYANLTFLQKGSLAVIAFILLKLVIIAMENKPLVLTW